MTMETHRQPGRHRPLCSWNGCNANADLVVAFESRDAHPFCYPCSNTVMRTEGGIEYPLEEYYSPAPSRVSQFDPYDTPKFTLFDPDDPDNTYLRADNAAADSSVQPHNNC